VSASYGSGLDALIAEATLDCRDEREAVRVFHDDPRQPGRALPDPARVTVDDIGLNAAEEIVAICSRGEQRQAIALIDLPLPADAPGGIEWIEAYRRWRT